MRLRARRRRVLARSRSSGSPGHPLAQAADLALLALDLGEQTPPGRGAQRLAAPELGGGRGARPELAARVDENWHPAGDRGPEAPRQEGSLLSSIGADPDRPRLAGDAGVGDVEVVRAGGEVLASAGAVRQVRVAGLVGVEGQVTERRVVVAGRVREQRLEAGGVV